MKVQHLSAEVCGVLVKAEISGADIVNIVSDFRGRTTASIKKYCQLIGRDKYKLVIYNKKLGLICSAFFSSKKVCMTKFWEELRYFARNNPPADLFDDGADSPTRGEFDLNNHEHNKADWEFS